MDCPGVGGWDTETIITHSAPWWRAGYFAGLYTSLASWNVSVITRIDYDWGQTVPAPATLPAADWAPYVVDVVNTLRHGGHLWQIGNEPNLNGEGVGWPGNQITPAGYAQIYRTVRNAIRASAAPSPLGPHLVLIAPPSPGGVVAGVRWMDGDQWLSQVIDNIPADEIDGFAIHAYGGSVTDFQNSFSATLTMIDGKGRALRDKPVYMTEWNRYSDPGQPAQEAAAAQFCRDAFAAVHSWNQTKGRHNIVAMTWFIYDADQQAGGGWNGYAIEYWRNNGYGPGDSRDLFTAFEQVVDLRYPAGVPGVRGVTADFSGTPTSGHVPLTVSFTDLSEGAVTSRSWTFGDGGTGTARDPVYTYNAPGIYTVSLTVTGPSGSDTATRTDYITVRPQPGDFDNDFDADQKDFGLLQACLLDDYLPHPEPACRLMDLSGEGAVGLTDVQLFLRCYSGPDHPVNPGCLN